MPDGSTFAPGWSQPADHTFDPAARTAMSQRIVSGLQRFGSANVMSVTELLLGFFRYYRSTAECAHERPAQLTLSAVASLMRPPGLSVLLTELPVLSRRCKSFQDIS